MSIYNQINKFIIKRQIRTITLDIFDTVLMRDVWPEDIQFYEVAKKWQPLFKKYFKTKNTPPRTKSIVTAIMYAMRS